MLDAHIKSMSSLGVPFHQITKMPFSFGPGTERAAVPSEARGFDPCHTGE